MWHLLIEGKKPILDSPGKVEAARMMSDANLIEKTGWTYWDIAECPEPYYEKLLTIYSMQAAHQEAKQKEAERKAKRKRGRR